MILHTEYQGTRYCGFRQDLYFHIISYIKNSEYDQEITEALEGHFYLLLITYYLLLVNYYLLLITYYLSLITYYLLLVISYINPYNGGKLIVHSL